MKIKVIVLGALCAVALTGCRASTEVSQVGVHVNGYDLIPTGATVADCIPPSTNRYIGLGDDAYYYPAGQRTFTFDTKRGSDFPPIEVVSKDKVTLTYTGSVTFYLNTDCKTLKAFHTAIGTKDWGGHRAYINDGYDGFRNMLDVIFGKPAQNALSDTAVQFPYLDQYTGAKRSEIEKEIAGTLEQRVKDFAGGDYFQRFKVLLNKPTAPEAIVKALEDQQAAVQENVAQKAKNATALTAYQQIQECKKLGNSEATCVTLYEVNSGKVTNVVIGGNPVGVGGGGK